GAGPRAYHLVDGECLAGVDDVTVEGAGDQLDVVDPGLTTVVVRGETGNPLDLGQRRRLDRLEVGQRPDEERRHLGPGHLAVRAVPVVVGRIASLRDPSCGESFDVVGVDRVSQIRESVPLPGGRTNEEVEDGRPTLAPT